MTSIRNSTVFTMEDTYGKGKPEGNAWIKFPPGTYVSFNHSRSATRIQSTGTKTWDAYAYGKFSGTFEITYVMDYEHLEPMRLVFESVTGPTEKVVGEEKCYEYVFKKVDNMRIPSFCMRSKTLNVMAGGPAGSDDVIERYGCVCTSATFARSSGASQMQVTLSGFYADERMVKGTLPSTDYSPYTPDLTEYSCLFIGAIDDSNYVANTETTTVAIDNSAEAIYNTCSAKPGQYAEGLTKYTFSTTCYSNDPSHYQQRVYSGGADNTALYPLNKGMAPIPLMHIATYNNETRDHTSRKEAYDTSTRSLDVEIKGCVIKSLAWPKGDGSKLQDVISGSECQSMTFKVLSGATTLATTADNPHKVESEDPTA